MSKTYRTVSDQTVMEPWHAVQLAMTERCHNYPSSPEDSALIDAVSAWVESRAGDNGALTFGFFDQLANICQMAAVHCVLRGE